MPPTHKVKNTDTEVVVVDYPEGLIAELKKTDKAILKGIKKLNKDLDKRADEMLKKILESAEEGAKPITKEQVMGHLATRFGLMPYKDYYVGMVNFSFIPQKLKQLIDAEGN